MGNGESCITSVIGNLLWLFLPREKNQKSEFVWDGHWELGSTGGLRCPAEENALCCYRHRSRMGGHVQSCLPIVSALLEGSFLLWETHCEQWRTRRGTECPLRQTHMLPVFIFLPLILAACLAMWNLPELISKWSIKQNPLARPWDTWWINRKYLTLFVNVL